MYYTKIRFNGETYEVSKEYNNRDLKKCLQYNFSSIMDNNFLLYNLNNFDHLIQKKEQNCNILHQNNNLICYCLGEFIDGNFRATIFCWNHIYKRFSSTLFRSWSLEVFRQAKINGAKYFIIPVLKHRENFKNYFKLMQRVFLEGELDPNLDTDNVKVLKINLSKIV